MVLNSGQAQIAVSVVSRRIAYRLLGVDCREQGGDASGKHDVEGNNEQVARLVVGRRDDAGDHGHGKDAEAHDVEERLVGKVLGSGDDLSRQTRQAWQRWQQRPQGSDCSSSKAEGNNQTSTLTRPRREVGLDKIRTSDELVFPGKV